MVHMRACKIFVDVGTCFRRGSKVLHKLRHHRWSIQPSCSLIVACTLAACLHWMLGGFSYPRSDLSDFALRRMLHDTVLARNLNTTASYETTSKNVTYFKSLLREVHNSSSEVLSLEKKIAVLKQSMAWVQTVPDRDSVCNVGLADCRTPEIVRGREHSAAQLRKRKDKWENRNRAYKQEMHEFLTSDSTFVYADGVGKCGPFEIPGRLDSINAIDAVPCAAWCNHNLHRLGDFAQIFCQHVSALAHNSSYFVGGNNLFYRLKTLIHIRESDVKRLSETIRESCQNISAMRQLVRRCRVASGLWQKVISRPSVEDNSTPVGYGLPEYNSKACAQARDERSVRQAVGRIHKKRCWLQEELHGVRQQLHELLTSVNSQWHQYMWPQYTSNGISTCGPFSVRIVSDIVEDASSTPCVTWCKQNEDTSVLALRTLNKEQHSVMKRWLCARVLAARTFTDFPKFSGPLAGALVLAIGVAVFCLKQFSTVLIEFKDLTKMQEEMKDDANAKALAGISLFLISEEKPVLLDCTFSWDPYVRLVARFRGTCFGQCCKENVASDYFKWKGQSWISFLTCKQNFSNVRRINVKCTSCLVTRSNQIDDEAIHYRARKPLEAIEKRIETILGHKRFDDVMLLAAGDSRTRITYGELSKMQGHGGTGEGIWATCKRFLCCCCCCCQGDDALKSQFPIRLEQDGNVEPKSVEQLMQIEKLDSPYNIDIVIGQNDVAPFPTSEYESRFRDEVSSKDFDFIGTRLVVGAEFPIPNERYKKHGRYLVEECELVYIAREERRFGSDVAKFVAGANEINPALLTNEPSIAGDGDTHAQQSVLEDAVTKRRIWLEKGGLVVRGEIKARETGLARVDDTFFLIRFYRKAKFYVFAFLPATDNYSDTAQSVTFLRKGQPLYCACNLIGIGWNVVLGLQRNPPNAYGAWKWLDIFGRFFQADVIEASSQCLRFGSNTQYYYEKAAIQASTETLINVPMVMYSLLCLRDIEYEGFDLPLSPIWRLVLDLIVVNADAGLLSNLILSCISIWSGLGESEQMVKAFETESGKASFQVMTKYKVWRLAEIWSLFASLSVAALLFQKVALFIIVALIAFVSYIPVRKLTVFTSKREHPADWARTLCESAVIAALWPVMPPVMIWPWFLWPSDKIFEFKWFSFMRSGSLLILWVWILLHWQDLQNILFPDISVNWTKMILRISQAAIVMGGISATILQLFMIDHLANSNDHYATLSGQDELTDYEYDRGQEAAEEILT